MGENNIDSLGSATLSHSVPSPFVQFTDTGISPQQNIVRNTDSGPSIDIQSDYLTVGASDMHGFDVPLSAAEKTRRLERWKTLSRKCRDLDEMMGAYVVFYCAIPEAMGPKDQHIFVSKNLQNIDTTLATTISRQIDEIHATAKRLARCHTATLALQTHAPNVGRKSPKKREAVAKEGPSKKKALTKGYGDRCRSVKNKCEELAELGVYVLFYSARPESIRTHRPHIYVSDNFQVDPTGGPTGIIHQAVDQIHVTAHKVARLSQPDDDVVTRKEPRLNRVRACDACRQRKTKCDGLQMVENKCTNCVKSHKSCTYMDESKPYGPSSAYVTALEDKVEQMEALLKMLRPELNFDAELGPPIIRDSWKINPFTHISTRLRPDPTGKPWPPRHSSPSPAVGKAQDLQSGSEDAEDDADIVRCMRLLNLNSEESSTSSNAPLRYCGEASDFGLLPKAHVAKRNYIEGKKVAEGNQGQMEENRRPEFWKVPSWELDWDGLNNTSLIGMLNSALPPADLSRKLIDLWFQNVNIHFPLLHRPTFEQQWQREEQYRDIWFAGLCLTIFAAASRWCDDERVLTDNGFNPTVSGDINLRGAGRKYFDAAFSIHHIRKTMVAQACLAEIQTHAAVAIYLRGTTEISVTWLCISLGLRKAQDLGAHRKYVYVEPADITEELWRRVYWILVVLDRLVSCTLGHPCCVRGTDCDLNLLTEVDDEYWDMNSKPPFTPIQPPGKPALVVAFNHLIRLTKNMELVMNSILAVGTSKLRIGIPRGPKWKEKVVMRTNIDLSKWIDSIPHHLRWSPSMSDRVFCDQAATLYTTYYLTQLLIYRPFTTFGTISDERQRKPFSNFPFPASTICINAAKACARILNVQMRRGFSNVTNLITTSYSPVMLLMDVWKNNQVRQTSQSRTTEPQSMSIPDAISVFIEALEWAALRWDSAHAFLQKIKASLPDSILEPTPRYSPDSVYPHHPIGFDSRTKTHDGEPDYLQPVPSLPFALPDPIEIAVTTDNVTDWLQMPQTPMYVSASYPPRNHHYLGSSNQSTWLERSHNDCVSSIYGNNPPPQNRPLTRTYSIDNFSLHSYSTVPVPGPSTGPTQQVTSAWESQAPELPNDRHADSHFGYEKFVAEPTPPMDIPWPMGQPRNDELSLDWNTDDFHRGFEQTFMSGSEIGYPEELPYPGDQ